MRKIKPKKSEGMMATSKKESSQPIWPSFRIELTHLPEAKKWEIGEEYEIGLKVKMTGLSISRYQNDAEFEIKEIEPEGAEEEKDE